MKRYSTADLRKKEIINLTDGARLGYAEDFEFDACDARLLSLMIPDHGGFFGIGKGKDLIIPWEKIECIGEDAVLVRLTPECFGDCRGGKNENRFS